MLSILRSIKDKDLQPEVCIREVKQDLSPIKDFLYGKEINIQKCSSEVLEIINLIKEIFANYNKLALSSAVDNFMIGSEIQAAVARSYSEVSESESEMEQMANAIEELNVSISQITELSNNTSISIDKTVQLSNQGTSEVIEAHKAADDVNNYLLAVDNNLNNLTFATNDIRDMAEEIDAIATQTNMLALNATIEAARAGEAGKGFAVVAQEVKQLSAQTTKSTENIRARIIRLENALSEIVGALGDAKNSAALAVEASVKANNSVAMASQAVQNGSEGVSNLANILSEQTVAVNELSRGINCAVQSSLVAKEKIDNCVLIIANSEKSLNKTMDELGERNIDNYVLYRAKADHVLWKKHLASLISGISSLQASELSDHNGCRLGKWWNNLKAQTKVHSQSFYAIEKPHQEVHNLGKEVARLFNDGDKRGALEVFAKMEKASDEVIIAIDALIAENERAN